MTALEEILLVALGLMTGVAFYLLGALDEQQETTFSLIDEIERDRSYHKRNGDYDYELGQGYFSKEFKEVPVGSFYDWAKVEEKERGGKEC